MALNLHSMSDSLIKLERTADNNLTPESREEAKEIILEKIKEKGFLNRKKLTEQLGVSYPTLAKLIDEAGAQILNERKNEISLRILWIERTIKKLTKMEEDNVINEKSFRKQIALILMKNKMLKERENIISFYSSQWRGRSF